MLADLHADGDEKDAGQFNLLSQLYSKGAGKALDLWVCRWIRWLVASNVASLILYYAFDSSLAATTVALLIHLLLIVPWTRSLPSRKRFQEFAQSRWSLVLYPVDQHRDHDAHLDLW